MSKGRTIRLYLMDGDASGRIKCTLANWTGVGYRIPRIYLEECKDTESLNQTGVYFLFGTDSDEHDVVYIGQARSRKNGKGILYRIQEQHPSIDYWTEAVIFTTTNNSFGPTEISYLENQFCNMAKESDRFIVKNGNDPNPGNITEEVQADLDEFIEYAKLIMGFIGKKLFDKNKSESLDDTEPIFYLRNKRGDYDAKGRITSDGFVVFESSRIKSKTAPKCPPHILLEREINKHKVDSDFVLVSDIYFKSPSGAAGFVCGSSVSGNLLWKDKNGNSLSNYM